MRRDIIIAFAIVLTAHVAVALVPKRGPKHVQHEDDIAAVKIELPPLPPPEPDETKDTEVTEAPQMAPPSLADVPTTVPIDAFVTPVEPPPPEGLVGGNIINIPVSHVNLGVKIFNLADLDQAPVIRFQAPIQYPFEMKRNGTTGTTQVGFICDSEGHVQNPYVVTSSGYTELDQAAIQGVTKWTFKPGRKGGHAVNVRMQIPIAFNLDQN
ncbi:MAG TPA: energy transducer TonB [Opitutaceae bacterium]|jgi:protein TonB|nr:energy transducer TonB [Opitutaceae bacterium]